MDLSEREDKEGEIYMDDMTVARQALAMLKQNMAAAECHVAAINHYRTLVMDAINLLEKMCTAPQPLTADEVKLKETVEPVLTAPVDDNRQNNPAPKDANTCEKTTSETATQADIKAAVVAWLPADIKVHKFESVVTAENFAHVDVWLHNKQGVIAPVTIEANVDGDQLVNVKLGQNDETKQSLDECFAAVIAETEHKQMEEKQSTRSRKKTKTKQPDKTRENVPEPEPEQKSEPESESKSKTEPEQKSEPEELTPEPDPEPTSEQVKPADTPPADPVHDASQVSRVVDMQTRVIELHYTQPEIEVMEQTFTNLVEFVKAHPGANEQSADPAAFEEFRATVTALPTEDELCSGVTEQLQRTMVNDLRYDVLLFLPSQRAETVAEWARTKHVKINGYDEFMADLQAKLAAEKAETKAKPEPEPEPEPEPTPEPTQTVVVQPDDVEPAPADVKPATPLLTAEDTPPVSVMPKETSWDEVEQEIAADRELATTAIMQAMTDGQPDVDDLKKEPAPTTSEGITTVDPQAERRAARKQETAPEPAPESESEPAPEPETKLTPTVDPTSKPMPWPEDNDPFAGYTPDGQAPADDKPFDPMAYEKVNQVPAKFMDIYVEKALSIYGKLAADFPDDELSRRTIAYENALETARLMDGGNDLDTAILKVGPRIARQVILLKGGRGK